MITVLVGKSASGKDTLMKKMLESGEYLPIISFTSRPMRNGETDGVEYHFVTREQFLKLQEEGFFMESRTYNTLVGGVKDVWYYGSPVVKAQEKEYITILDVNGAEEFIEYYGKENIKVIYLYVSDEVRERRAMGRGSFDRSEWDRRKEDDDIKFSRDKIDALAGKCANFHWINND